MFDSVSSSCSDVKCSLRETSTSPLMPYSFTSQATVVTEMNRDLDTIKCCPILLFDGFRLDLVFGMSA